MNKPADSRQLRELIRLLERKFGVLESHQLSCCKVTFAQCHAIVEIGRAGKISLNDLANLLNLDNSTMSRTVNNLVNNDFVKRDIDPKDRRYVTISLTEKGIQIFNEIEGSMNDYYSKVFERLPLNKRPQVLESLELLLGALTDGSCCSNK